MNLEQLLQHREFLAALARVLVSDPLEQEELLWETMGEGATRFSRLEELAPSSLKLWLARVMRNRAIDRHRAMLRRREHEPAGAKPVAVGSASELAARFELGEHLAQHVQALDPGYREVVLFRFYDNLPPREIAKRLDLPVETVKTRLRRALVMLRERLDQEHGSRDKWLGSFVPFAFPSVKAVGVGITTTGVLLMMTKTKVAIAVVAALLFFGAWSFWTSQEGDALTILDTPDQAQSQVQAGDSPTDHSPPIADSQRVLIPEERSPQGKAVSTVQVKVIDDRTGKVIPDAKVVAVGEDAPLQETRTDEDGTCSVENSSSGLLLEASAKGYIIARSAVASEATHGVVRLALGSSVRVHLRGPIDKVAKSSIRLVLIPRFTTGLKGMMFSATLVGRGGRLGLSGYLNTMDELQAVRQPTASPEIRRKWMKAWGPGLATGPEVQNPFAVADRRFMSLGSEGLIRTLGPDGRAVWEGLPPGKAYRIGMLSGARILFPAAAAVRPIEKPKPKIFFLPPDPPAGTNLSRAFDLDPGETREILADLLSPESQLRFTMSRELMPKGSKCIVSVQSIVAGWRVGPFDCEIGTNERSLDLDGPVYVKFHWKLPAHHHRFRAYQAHLTRGEEVDLGSVAWLAGASSSKLRWVPSYNGVDLPSLELSPLPRLRIQGTLHIGHAKYDREAMYDMLNEFSFNESIPLGTDLVFEGIDVTWITAFGRLLDDQKDLLVRGVAKRFGIDEMMISDPQTSSLHESIEPNEVLELKTVLSSSLGTEVRIPALANITGSLGTILVGQAVRKRSLKVSAHSDKSGTRVVIRGEWSGSATLWLENPNGENGRRVWQVSHVQAGMRQTAVAHEARQKAVRFRVVDVKKKHAVMMLMGAYSDYAGSAAPGGPISGYRLTLLDKKGEGTLLLPVGSIWSFRLNSMTRLSLSGSPTVQEFKVTEGMGLIELQPVPK